MIYSSQNSTRNLDRYRVVRLPERDWEYTLQEPNLREILLEFSHRFVVRIRRRSSFQTARYLQPPWFPM